MNLTRTMLYVAMFCAGFVAVSLWSFWFAIRPPQILVGQKPEDFDLAAEDVELIADDGTRLAAWFIPEGEGADEKRALIFLHGYPAEKSDMLGIAASFNPDFALFLMDLRSFGESGGAYTTLGLKERDDVMKAIDFLEERGYERIGIFGFSLGGAVALLAAERNPRITAVATYSAFSDLRSLGHETYSHLFIFKYPLVALMELWARLLFGEWVISSASPRHAAAKLSIPVLLVHSREDEQISFTHAERLKDALSHNAAAEMYLIERGWHGALPPDFSGRVRAFFERVL